MPEIKSNFHWDTTTDRRLTVFMPCYHNIDVVEYTVRRLTTVLDPWEYIIIIGNDGFHHDWSKLCNELISRDSPVPVAYFSLLHKKPQPRNGAFIRNYALKRCKSKYFFQKDSEVVLEGDGFWRSLRTCEQGGLWRAGIAVVLDKNDSKEYMLSNSLEGLSPTIQKRIEPVAPLNAVDTKAHIVEMNGQVNFTSFFHYAYCAPTKVLQGIHGYDEAFKYYGYEDSDMFCRLAAMGYKFVPDYSCWAIHLWHPSTVNTDMLMEMGKVFQSKNPNTPLRNEESWGEGI